VAKTTKVKATLGDAVSIRAVWATIPEFKMGSTSLNDFIALEEGTANLDKEYATKGTELTGVKNNRDDSIRRLSALITRFRSGMRSTYGPDSPQYAQAGGTPNSARKAPTRKKKTANPTKATAIPKETATATVPTVNT
jgi:hypothetical protein